MIVVLITAVAALLAGVLAILIGVPVKEFSFGNTMILAGAMAICTGFVLFGLWVTIREMHALARRIAAPASAGLHDPSLPELGATPAKPPFPPRSPARDQAASAPPQMPPPPEPMPPVFPPFSHDDIQDRPPPDLTPTPVAEPAPEPKPRRNLLFESSVRKDRERAAAATNGANRPPADAGPRTPSEDAWPQGREEGRAERPARPPRPRSPSTFADSRAAPSDVTVLKSGVVDGMSYSLYSDGSIEAQMPEGMMRFTSIDELRAHLDQRP